MTPLSPEFQADLARLHSWERGPQDGRSFDTLIALAHSRGRTDALADVHRHVQGAILVAPVAYREWSIERVAGYIAGLERVETFLAELLVEDAT